MFGVPLATVEWFVVTEEGVMAVTIDNTSVQIETTESDVMVTSTLTLLSIQPSQSGVYLCMASNSLGNDTAQADIIVYSKLIYIPQGIMCNHTHYSPTRHLDTP